MPALSKAQSRYLNMKFGHSWVEAHHFDNSTKGLPQHVGNPRKRMKKKSVHTPINKALSMAKNKRFAGKGKHGVVHVKSATNKFKEYRG